MHYLDKNVEGYLWGVKEHSVNGVILTYLLPTNTSGVFTKVVGEWVRDMNGNEKFLCHSWVNNQVEYL